MLLQQEVVFLPVISLAEDSSYKEWHTKSEAIKWKVFLEYGPTHTDSMKLLAVTEQTPKAIYLCRVHENLIYFHSLW